MSEIIKILNEYKKDGRRLEDYKVKNAPERYESEILKKLEQLKEMNKEISNLQYEENLMLQNADSYETIKEIHENYKIKYRELCLYRDKFYREINISDNFLLIKNIFNTEYLRAKNIEEQNENYQNYIIDSLESKRDNFDEITRDFDKSQEFSNIENINNDAINEYNKIISDENELNGFLNEINEFDESVKKSNKKKNNKASNKTLNYYANKAAINSLVASTLLTAGEISEKEYYEKLYSGISEYREGAEQSLLQRASDQFTNTAENLSEKYNSGEIGKEKYEQDLRVARNHLNETKTNISTDFALQDFQSRNAIYSTFEDVLQKSNAFADSNSICVSELEKIAMANPDLSITERSRIEHELPEIKTSREEYRQIFEGAEKGKEEPYIERIEQNVFSKSNSEIKDSSETNTHQTNPDTAKTTKESVKTFVDSGLFESAMKKADNAAKQSANLVYDLTTSGTEFGEGVNVIKTAVGVVSAPFSIAADFGEIDKKNAYAAKLRNSFELNSNFNALADSLYASLESEKFDNCFDEKYSKGDFVGRVFTNKNEKNIFSAKALEDSAVRNKLSAVLTASLSKDGYDVSKMDRTQLKALLNNKKLTDEQRASVKGLLHIKELNGYYSTRRTKGDVLSDKVRSGLRKGTRFVFKGTEFDEGLSVVRRGVYTAKKAYRVSRSGYKTLVNYRYSGSIKTINRINAKVKDGQAVNKYTQRRLKRANKIKEKGRYSEGRLLRIKRTPKKMVSDTFSRLRGKAFSRISSSAAGRAAKHAASSFARSKAGNAMLRPIRWIKTGTSVTAQALRALTSMLKKLFLALAKYILIALLILFILIYMYNFYGSVISAVTNMLTSYMSSSDLFDEDGEDDSKNVLQKVSDHLIEVDTKWWEDNVNKASDSVKSVNGSKIEGFITDPVKGEKYIIDSFGKKKGDDAFEGVQVRYVDMSNPSKEVIPNSNYKALLATFDSWITFASEDDEDADIKNSEYSKKGNKFIDNTYEKLHVPVKTVHLNDDGSINKVECANGDGNFYFDCSNTDGNYIKNVKNMHIVGVGTELFESKERKDKYLNDLIDGSVPKFDGKYLGIGCEFYYYTLTTVTHFDKHNGLIEPKRESKTVNITGKNGETVTVNKDCKDFCEKMGYDILDLLDYSTGAKTTISVNTMESNIHTIPSGKMYTYKAIKSEGDTWEFYYGKSLTDKKIADIYQGGVSITGLTSGCDNLTPITTEISLYVSTDHNDFYGTYNPKSRTLTFHNDTKGGTKKPLTRILYNIDLYGCGGHTVSKSKEVDAGVFPERCSIYFCPVALGEKPTTHQLQYCHGHVIEDIAVKIAPFSMEDGADNSYFFSVIKDCDGLYDNQKEFLADESNYDLVLERTLLDWEDEYDVIIPDYAAGFQVEKIPADVISALKRGEQVVGSSVLPYTGTKAMQISFNPNNSGGYETTITVGSECSGDYTLKVNNNQVCTFNVKKDASTSDKITVSNGKLPTLAQGKTYNIKLFKSGTDLSNVETITIVKKTKGFVWPLYEADSYISSGYDIPRSVGTGDNHSGIDICSNKTGATVYAVADGRVLASYNASDSGNTLVIGFESGDKIYCTVYYHLSQRLVNAGDTVTAGQAVGNTGNTGSLSHGEHLHFSVYYSDYNTLNEIPLMSYSPYRNKTQHWKMMYPGELFEGFPEQGKEQGAVYSQKTG